MPGEDRAGDRAGDRAAVTAADPQDGRPRFHRHARRPGRGRVVVPELDVAPPDRLAADLRAAGCAARPDPATRSLLVTAGPASFGEVAARLHAVGPLAHRVEVELNAAPPANAVETAVRLLAEAGVAAVVLARPADGDEVAAAEVAARIELGKACLSRTLPLRWTGRLPAAYRDAWRHLPPARDDPDARRRWRYASLSWRRGPDFAFVHDARTADAREITLDLGRLVAAFGADLATAAPAGGDPELQEDLAGLGLTLRIGTAVTWLPYRLRHWPTNWTE